MTVPWARADAGSEPVDPGTTPQLHLLDTVLKANQTDVPKLKRSAAVLTEFVKGENQLL